DWDTVLGRVQLSKEGWFNLEEAAGTFTEIFPGGNSGEGTMKLDSSGEPMVAWLQDDGVNVYVYFSQWDEVDQRWETMDGTAGAEDVSLGLGGVVGVRLEVFNDQPYVLWSTSNELYFTRWNSG